LQNEGREGGGGGGHLTALCSGMQQINTQYRFHILRNEGGERPGRVLFSVMLMLHRKRTRDPLPMQRRSYGMSVPYTHIRRGVLCTLCPAVLLLPVVTTPVLNAVKQIEWDCRSLQDRQWEATFKLPAFEPHSGFSFTIVDGEGGGLPLHSTSPCTRASSIVATVLRSK
jgi:hypothetical protein